MNRFDDGIEEWREEMAESDDWQEQRKANYVPVDLRHEQALEFMEREKDRAVKKILERFEYCKMHNEIFLLRDEIKIIKRAMIRRGECTPKEAKAMFKYATNNHHSAIIRELILINPEIANYTCITKCGMSKHYPQLKHLEEKHNKDLEEGGISAA